MWTTSPLLTLGKTPLWISIQHSTPPAGPWTAMTSSMSTMNGLSLRVCVSSLLPPPPPADSSKDVLAHDTCKLISSKDQRYHWLVKLKHYNVNQIFLVIIISYGKTFLTVSGSPDCSSRISRCFKNCLGILFFIAVQDRYRRRCQVSEAKVTGSFLCAKGEVL